MTLFLAFCQPDGDWDHMATIIGVFSTRALAEAQHHAYSASEFQVLELALDELSPEMKRLQERLHP